ncbi:MAG: hypothetical protein C0478_10435 [Planctomyces sp.]|nr:hypothetical protein [Planctomyces sp.]
MLPLFCQLRRLPDAFAAFMLGCCLVSVSIFSVEADDKPSVVVASKGETTVNPTRIASHHLENLHRLSITTPGKTSNAAPGDVSRDYYLGGSPETEEAMAELAAAGVKTVISVDGAPPLVELARKHGLTYIHIPVKYSTLTREQIVTITAALERTKDNVYLHCHHGKHRGPAALVAALKCTHPEIETDPLLKLFGTDPKYGGLYSAAHSVTPLQAEELTKVPVKLPESITTATPARMMAEIDARFDRLKKIPTPLPPADIDLLQTLSVELEEDFREFGRLGKDPESSRKLLDDSIATVIQLRQFAESAKAGRSGVVPAEKVQALVLRLEQSCKICHKQHRD